MNGTHVAIKQNMYESVPSVSELVRWIIGHIVK